MNVSPRRGADPRPFRVSLVPSGVRFVLFCAQNVLFCAVLCIPRAPGRPSVASTGRRRACFRTLTPCPSRACIRFRRISIFALRVSPRDGQQRASCALSPHSRRRDVYPPLVGLPALCVAGRGLPEVAACHSTIARHYSSSNGMSRAVRKDLRPGKQRPERDARSGRQAPSPGPPQGCAVPVRSQNV